MEQEPKPYEWPNVVKLPTPEAFKEITDRIDALKAEVNRITGILDAQLPKG